MDHTTTEHRTRQLRNALRGIPLLTLVLLLSNCVYAQDAAHDPGFCGTRVSAQALHPTGQVGGIYIPSSGLLRVLIVFASFPDDETPHPFWPAHNPPLFMNQFIDPDTMANSQAPFNLTNYFRQMSLGRFHLVGEAVWIESAHSQEEYRNGSYGRANWSLLQESVDPVVDFSQYDHWTRDANFQHRNVPDDLVDMIIMVWRTTLWRVYGEASLGYKPGFTVDGKRIEMGFPEYVPLPVGSGVTCEYPYSDSPYQVMQTMVHELSHWLLGGPHPYNGTTLSGKHAYWGMLCDGQRTATCANSYDREKLGWIIVPEIQPDQDIVLSDFVTAGMAYKYHPVNGEPLEYFYIENHQGASTFDDVTTNSNDRGIWLLQQQGPYVELDNLRIRPSDGCWHWENPFSTSLCFSQQLPVFRRGEPAVLTGESHRDQIPNPSSSVNWMFAYQDPLRQLHCGTFFRGDIFSGAFNEISGSVFSPFSNPASATWDGQPTPFSLEVVAESGGNVTVRLNSNPVDAAPARRYLGRDPDDPDTLARHLSLAWGAQWTEGQGLESDVNWSELQRQVGNGGEWSAVYSGTALSWSDETTLYDTSGTVPVLFRVRVRDTQNKYSSWSNVFATAIGTTSGADGPEKSVWGYDLEPCYPNPFNPTTRIRFNTADRLHVTLKVTDLLGRDVRTLVDEELSAGHHERVFEAQGLASGVYLCRLHVGRYTRVQKLLLVR